MKKLIPVCAIALMAFSSGAWAQDASTSKMSDSKMSSGKMGGSDAKFAKEAAAGGIAEVKLGRLATDKGSSDFVKQFGQRMVNDHGKANEELAKTAQQDNITLPTDVMPKDQALYDRLSKLSGTEFDQAYIAAMKKDHKMDIAEFQKEANSGKNTDIKNFATHTLPVIQEHLSMLESQKMM